MMVVPRTDGKCALLIQQSDEQMGCIKCSIGCACGVNWIIGTAAARSHCWLYDYEKQQVAIAKAH
ncbi:hypothetical protein AAVH_31310 [Aphelenchoides avenae]|nr:hypothetical protein AAVH_31310 [Aphelenchus avenae]